MRMGTAEETFRRFGRNIKRALDASGRTLDEVAEQALMEKAEVEQMIAGDDLDVTVEALFVLGGTLNTEPASLLEGLCWMPYKDRPGGEYLLADD